jgi:hypothetical protein
MRVSAEFCFARKSAVLQHKNSGGAQRKTTVGRARAAFIRKI